ATSNGGRSLSMRLEALSPAPECQADIWAGQGDAIALRLTTAQFYAPLERGRRWATCRDIVLEFVIEAVQRRSISGHLIRFAWQNLAPSPSGPSPKSARQHQQPH